MQKGDFLDAIFNCPFELHELVENERLSKAVKKLKPEHKELLFYMSFPHNLPDSFMFCLNFCHEIITFRSIIIIVNKKQTSAES